MIQQCRLLAVVVFALLAAVSYAADGNAQQERPNRREYAELDAQLMELDKDHDGKLDHGELIGALRALKHVTDPAIVGQIDANKNGRIDRKELKKFLDADADGKIDHGELRRYLISIKQNHPDIYAQIVAADVPAAREAKPAK